MSMIFFLLHQNSCWGQSAPLFSVGNNGEVDKWICQVELPNDVKSLINEEVSKLPPSYQSRGCCSSVQPDWRKWAPPVVSRAFPVARRRRQPLRRLYNPLSWPRTFLCS